jgi:Flp pilus assembly protein TadG
MRITRRQQKGQALIELAVGALFLIPLALFSLDIVTLVLANATNDVVAKNAARAAANQPTSGAAKQAADKAIAGVHKSTIITALGMKNFDYSKESVTVKTEIDVHLPVAFPGFAHYVFVAQSVQPIVAQ